MLSNGNYIFHAAQQHQNSWTDRIFSSSAMNFMKNNPNSDYDQINSKFNKKIGKSKAHARLIQKCTRNAQLNINKQEANEDQFLIEKLKNENNKTAPN